MTDFDYCPDLDNLVFDENLLRQEYEEHLFNECVAQAKEKLNYFNYLVNDLNIAKKEAMGVLLITDTDLKNYRNLIAIAERKRG